MRYIYSCCLVIALAINTQAKEPIPKMDETILRSGSVEVSPTSGISGEFGTWTVTHTVGKAGIAVGGGIRVQLPDAWHAGPRNSANRLQHLEAAEDHYVSARCSRPDVTLRTIVEDVPNSVLVKNAKFSLDGRKERYVFVVRVEIVEGQLQEDDTIHVTYGDTSGGSKGYRAGAVSTGPLPLLLAVDPEGDQVYSLNKDRPKLTLEPGAATELLLHAPSQAETGKTVTILASLLDKEFNPAYGPATLKIVTSETMDGPETVRIPKGATHAEFRVSFEVSNTWEELSWVVSRVLATWQEKDQNVFSNPIELHENEPALKTYWGDLHSHTHYSWDGVGYDQFAYAEYTSGLDFYAMSDHSIKPDPGFTRGLYEGVWEQYTAETDAANKPGQFATLHGYECSFPMPYGHHNVYFRNKPGPLLNPQSVILPQLWEALTEGQALTIPHHTGKFPSNVDFKRDDPRFRRNFEMYSGHGLSEVYDPSHPLAFEHSLFTSDARSLNWPSHYQDGLRLGLQVSAIAASDDHRAHPGLSHYGLVAVTAPELTRDDIFQGLYDRRTYATTGAKILFDFRINGTPGGQRVKLSPGKNTITIKAAGTQEIEFVEILRLDKGARHFEVVKRWEMNTLNSWGVWEDPDMHPGAIYYARLKQHGKVRNRIAMAWSSPIWID